MAQRGKIVVTGAAGFIGSNLSDRLLRAGFSVVGIDNLSAGLKSQVPPAVKFIRADIRDKNLARHFQGARAIFHLAAKNCIADCEAAPAETIDVNVTGTVNVFASALKAKVSRVIYAESSAVYEGSKIYPTPETESHPQSIYAQSKWAARQIVQTLIRPSKIAATALRYFCVYGPRQDYRRSIPPVMSAFILRLLAGERPVIFGSGRKRRDFVYVDDVNDFHLQCLSDPRTAGRVFNLGSGVNYSVLEIYREISRLLGKKINPIFLKDKKFESEKTLASIAAARRLGWRPRTDLRSGLQRSIDYIQNVVLKRG